MAELGTEENKEEQRKHSLAESRAGWATPNLVHTDFHCNFMEDWKSCYFFHQKQWFVLNRADNYWLPTW